MSHPITDQKEKIKNKKPNKIPHSLTRSCSVLSCPAPFHPTTPRVRYPLRWKNKAWANLKKFLESTSATLFWPPGGCLELSRCLSLVPTYDTDTGKRRHGPVSVASIRLTLGLEMPNLVFSFIRGWFHSFRCCDYFGRVST
jgi:hypothetical protein